MYTRATSADRSCIRLRVQVLSGRGYSFKSLDIVRVIDILPHQTLKDLSGCIETAFDRELDFHLWEFYFGAKRPYDRNDWDALARKIAGQAVAKAEPAFAKA